MLTRLTHSAIAFAITVVVYQAYVLFAAPFIEPPLVVEDTKKVFEEREPTHKYRELLAAYFPPGHWTLTQPPITAGNGQAMIVIDEFNPRDDGQMRVKKCAILFFPQGRVRGEPPPHDTVVLEAPHGAVLQMDKSFRRGVGSFGRLQWGKLTGQITIRSDMREPGTHDDLLLTTRDLEIRENLIYTKDLVDMRLGPHRGRGRELEIRLKPLERGRTQSQGPNLGSIDSLEILHEVEAQLSPGQVQFAPTTHATDAPPVKITSVGPFRFDFSRQIASFNEQVLLSQLHPQGQLDQLRCEKLSVYFTRDQPSTATHDPRGKLAPGSIEILGTDSLPVVLNAPSQEATARCQRMRIELGPQRVTFDQGHQVALTYQGNEIHAKQVQYQAPPKDSDQRIGKLLAAGRGWFRARTSDEKGAEPFEVRWLENMHLRRINGLPVLSLNGRPQLDMVGMGKLWADHIDLYLRESATDGSEADLLPSDIVPERLVAGGQIAIDSAQLHGKVKELKVRFEYVPSDLMLNGPSSSNPRTGRSPLGQRGFSGGRGDAGKRAYDIVGETLEMLVTVRNRKPEVTSIDVDGQVVFNESSNTNSSGQGASKEPLKVEADHLRVTNADSPDAELTLTGRPATITADGMVIRTQNLQVHRGTSRAWVKAPGEIEMLLDHDLSGKRLATPQPMTIRWQQGMDLNQDRITFNGNVQVQTAEGTLNTQQMIVRLTAPVQFDGAARQRRIEIAQLECHGGANAIFSQRDALGLASVQTIKLKDSFYANLQNGKIRGEGPGRMESVHLSTGTNPIKSFANNKNRSRERLASASRQPQATQPLRFLGIEFNRGIQGNLQSRQVKVIGDVDAVYGPVDSWEQRLTLTKRGMPGPETVWINCQSLDVAESPLARLKRSQQSGIGPLELLAEGNPASPVTIEGPAGERGNFTTRSLRAKYDQTKKTFILEGTNRHPATILMQEYRGGPTSPTSARKFTYSQEAGNVTNIEGLVSGQFRQLAPAGGR